jgi:signal transduction histidine kinase
VASADDVPIAVNCEPDHAPVDTDAERLRSVLVNVLANAQHAVRARPQASGTRPAVQLRVRRGTADRWRIEVVDRGVGIAPDDLPRLFEPFFTTRPTGSGLGLALARNIIEGLGGTIAADSRLGAGTTVRIDLPGQAMRAGGRM